MNENIQSTNGIAYEVSCDSVLQVKPQMGMMESLKFLVSSPYIRDLATLVVAYGISINLVEVTWKSKLKAQVRNGEV